MAKNLRRLAALAALPLLLAGCSQKVDFETFKEKAEAAVEARDDKVVSYLKIKGTWQDESVNFSTEDAKDMTFSELAIAALVLAEINVTFYTAAENEDATYSVGGGFVISYKPTDSDGGKDSWKRTYNTKGYLTNYSSVDTVWVQDDDFGGFYTETKKTNITVSYVFEK